MEQQDEVAAFGAGRPSVEGEWPDLDLDRFDGGKLALARVVQKVCKTRRVRPGRAHGIRGNQ
jgi:hypothetical protein